ncbi:hypothetical protein CK221_28820 [Mesorhizobium sp. WSM3868]|nr:hypothetical protein CK221_28820 [Mesorhizobium sp. WSM3868]
MNRGTSIFAALTLQSATWSPRTAAPQRLQMVQRCTAASPKAAGEITSISPIAMAAPWERSLSVIKRFGATPCFFSSRVSVWPG